MGAKVYIETSVVSYYTARPNRNIVIAGVTVRWVVGEM